MGPTKKQKDKIKKMNEARLRQLEEARGPVARLGEEGRRVESAAASPPPPPAVLPPAAPPPPPPSPPPAQPSTSSRSSFKLENVPHIDVPEDTSRRYMIVDIDNLLQWVKQFARCDCGKKMIIREVEKQMGNVTFLNARCSDCNKDFPMCSSVGGGGRGPVTSPSYG